MRKFTLPQFPHRRLVLSGAALVTSVALLTSCSAITDATEAEASNVEAVDVQAANVTVAQAMAENHDYWTATAESADTANAEQITLQGTSAKSTSDGVTVADGTVTITAAGVYSLSGSYTGQLLVEAADEDEVTLILDGVDISHEGGAAMLFSNADGVSVVLAEGSTNKVSDAGTLVEGETATAAIYAKTDVQVSGAGSLEVDGARADGISTTKDLVVTSGTVKVTAADRGMRGKDALVITGGQVTVDATGDALKSNNTDDEDRGYILLTGGIITVTSGQDAITAATDLLITGGTITAAVGGGHTASETATEVSAKGLKSGVLTVIEGGTVTVDAADDAVHSNGSIHVAGGELALASGDDGIHADEALLVSDGTLDITESYEGLEASAIEIAGGDITILASDDGINASNSAGSSTASDADGAGFAAGEGGPGTAGDDRPEMPEGDIPDMGDIPEGEMPEMPEGGMPDMGDMPEGEMPEMPDMGEMGGPGGMDSDDGSTLVISGGTLQITAEGDGIDSNGTLQITGGDVTVFGTARGGNGAFDSNGEFELTGGTVLAVSAGQMEQSPNDGGQPQIEAAVSGAAGDQIEVHAGDSTVLVTVEAAKDFGYVFYSDASVEAGESYVVQVNGEVTEVVAGEAAASTGMGASGGPGAGGNGGGRANGRAAGAGSAAAEASGADKGTPPARTETE